MVRKGNGKVKVVKASAKIQPAKVEELKNLTIVPAYPNPFPSFYANYASVSHTASEIFIDCCLMGMPYDVNLDESQVTVPVIARIIMPPTVAIGLITALQAQTEKQKETVTKGTLVVAALSKPKEGTKT